MGAFDVEVYAARSKAARGEPVPGRRTGAAFIDLVPLAVVAIGWSERQTAEGRATATLAGFGLLIVVITFFGYYLSCELLTGTTPGKYLLGLVVVDPAGHRPSRRDFMVRNAMRIVDVLPVFYVVGFVAMLSSRHKQRVGDMVAETHVVRRQGTAIVAAALPLRRRDPLALVFVALATVGIGIAGFARDGDASNDAVGVFAYDNDVVPFVDRFVKAALESGDPSRLMGLTASGATSEAEVVTFQRQLEETLGAWTGSYGIVRHVRAPDTVYTQLGPAPVKVMEVYIETTFEKGPARVRLLVGDVGGELRVLAWDVRPT